MNNFFCSIIWFLIARHRGYNVIPLVPMTHEDVGGCQWRIIDPTGNLSGEFYVFRRNAWKAIYYELGFADE